MMSVKDIEQACDIGQQLDFSRHELEGPELLLRKTYHPFGFAIEVRTNAVEVLDLLQELWGMFDKVHDNEPIRCDIFVAEGGSAECPPTPEYRLALPWMISIADGKNYTIVDLERKWTQISISRAALQHPLYLKYFILGAPVCCITTSYATPIHAGCVALEDRGILLCGDSGAGKSSLAFACARKGWTYITDDAAFLLNGGTKRIVSGSFHQVRLRPTAAELFPEIRDLEITPRAAGKPSIEMPTASFPNIVSAHTAHIDFVVFLNRQSGNPPELVPYRKDVARYFMRQVLFGQKNTLETQYQAIDRLLAVDVFELRYTDLDWGVCRLQKLVLEGA